MPRYGKWVLRLVGALALFVALQPFSSLIEARDAGRDFARCVQNCNDARKACDDACKPDCTALFPGDENQAARDACVDACKNSCFIESEDCKLVCQQNRNEHVEEP